MCCRRPGWHGFPGGRSRQPRRSPARAHTWCGSRSTGRWPIWQGSAAAGRTTPASWTGAPRPSGSSATAPASTCTPGAPALAACWAWPGGQPSMSHHPRPARCTPRPGRPVPCRWPPPGGPGPSPSRMCRAGSSSQLNIVQDWPVGTTTNVRCLPARLADTIWLGQVRRSSLDLIAMSRRAGARWHTGGGMMTVRRPV